MLDHVMHYPRCGDRLGESQGLILRAIWALEDASEVFEKLVRKVGELDGDIRDVLSGGSFVGHNVKEGLTSLYLVRAVLFGEESSRKSQGLFRDGLKSEAIRRLRQKQQNVDDFPRDIFRRRLIPTHELYIDRMVTQYFNNLLRKEQNLLGLRLKTHYLSPAEMILSRPALKAIARYMKTGIQPIEIYLDVKASGSLRDKSVIMAIKWSDSSFRTKHKILSTRDPRNRSVQKARFLNKEPPSCQEMIESACSTNTFDIRAMIKRIRLYLQQRYDCEDGGVPVVIIEQLSFCETVLQIERDQLTDSIWNVQHQENRREVLEESDVGVAYRQKCICGEGAVHGLDVYCPRNIPMEAENRDLSDGEDGLDMRKKKKRNVSPHQGAEENSWEDEEAARVKAIEKEKEAEREKAMAEIMILIGLENVKDHVRNIKAMIETATRQGVDLKKERFGTIFLGNPGTGKTTVARQYAKYLCNSGVVGGEGYTETTGIYLADGGIARTKSYIDGLAYNGGIFFVDEAHQMISDDHHGKKVLDFILDEVEAQRGKVIFILAGNDEGMRKLLGRSSRNVRSLFPHVLVFQDYSDDELLQILGSCITKKFAGKMEVEGGLKGLYMRIAAKRVGRGRDAARFGNTRAVENMFAQIWERQSARLTGIRRKREELQVSEKQTTSRDKEKLDGDISDSQNAEILKVSNATSSSDGTIMAAPKAKQEAVATVAAASSTAEQSPKEESNEEGSEIEKREEYWTELDTTELEAPEDYVFTKDDILGPDPTGVILESPGWMKLQKLAGLEDVKHSIRKLLETVKSNYQRELEEKPLHKLSLNRLFLGPPGTGKTLVAKLYGQILAEIGALSKGEVIVRTPSDIIGKYIGHSESNMKALMSAAVGNVLVIDETHMLYSGSSDGTGNESDVFRQSVVDTLVGEIQSDGRDDRCVLLLGYGDQLQEMLQNSNPGLARRFPFADAFWFHSYTLPELECILRSKLQDHLLWATEPAFKVAMDVLEKASTRVNFGNGGEVENLISRAKGNYQSRMSQRPGATGPEKWIFLPQDFDKDFDRGKSATINLWKLFKDVVGCDDIVRKLEQYQRVSQVMKLKCMSPKGYIPTNFVFKGPPGTGKTTTARKIAQVYYDMGFLSEAAVVECSASDLVGKYIGHSGPKTMKVLERGLGKVLFIDEAYRLAHGGDNSSYTSEVISELVDLLTKPKFHGKLVVILAGYSAEMNRLLSINPGLASRFPEELNFPALGPLHSLQILKIKLALAGIAMPVLDQPKLMPYKNLVRAMGLLAETPSWGNARDVETLAKTITMRVFADIKNTDDELVCSTEIATAAMEAMLRERRNRAIPTSVRNGSEERIQ